MSRSGSMSTLDRRNLRRFALEMAAVLLVGAVVIVALPAAIQSVDEGSAAHAAIALLPLCVPALAVVVGVRNDRRSDEFQRTLQYQAIYFAFFATGLVTFAYGLLELTGLPALSMLTVWLVMTVMWVIGWCVALFRSRTNL